MERLEIGGQCAVPGILIEACSGDCLHPPKKDERDLDKVRLGLPQYRRFAENSIPACGALEMRETETLSLDADLMTLEGGLRLPT